MQFLLLGVPLGILPWLYIALIVLLALAKITPGQAAFDLAVLLVTSYAAINAVERRTNITW